MEPLYLEEKQLVSLRQLLGLQLNQLLRCCEAIRDIEAYLPCTDREFIQTLAYVEKRVGEVIHSKFGGKNGNV